MDFFIFFDDLPTWGGDLGPKLHPGDTFMTMCPPISSVESDLFMRLGMEIDEIYTKI